jgi:endonuclease YncB( thermonuclease family)
MIRKIDKPGKILLPFISLLFIISAFLNIFFFRQIKKNEEGIKVLGVIDGDTLVLEGKVRVRLRNLDAPELELCGGKEAKEELEKLVSGKKVVIQEQIIDQWGRPMALVFVDKVLVNEKMLESGWARFHSDSSSQREALKQANDEAKKKLLGIWSAKCQQTKNVDNPKCIIKGNVAPDSGKKIYYFPGCSQYEFTIIEKDIGENWFCTEKEAQEAGFVRSKTCPSD